MEIRKSYLEMIRAYPGGWEAMPVALEFSRTALQNRIYDSKGQSVSVPTAMAMQTLSNTTFFAEAVAQESGGIFMRLPDVKALENEDLLGEFNKLYGQLGELSIKFRDAVGDNEIDQKERAALVDAGQNIHQTLAGLLALTFAVYCREGVVGR